MLINQKDLENIAKFWGSTYEEYPFRILVVGETEASAKEYSLTLMSQYSEESIIKRFTKMILSKNFSITFTSKEKFYLSRGHYYNFIIVENLEEMLENRFLTENDKEIFDSISISFSRELSSTRYRARKIGSEKTMCDALRIPEASLSYNNRLLSFEGKLPALSNMERKWNQKWNSIWGNNILNNNQLNVLLIGNTKEDIYEMALKITRTYNETLKIGSTTPLTSESFRFSYSLWEEDKAIPKNIGIELVVAKDWIDKTTSTNRMNVAYQKILGANDAIGYTYDIIDNKKVWDNTLNKIIDWKNIKFYL